MTGEWPLGEIDHANRVRSDNRWENIRDAHQGGNKFNRSMSSRNTSGYKGVVWSKTRQKWLAQIRKGYARTTIGAFSCPIKAAAAYDKAAKEKFGEYAALNFQCD
jgi:hypothetical protein